MKRNLLEGMGLNKEQIDQIMEENGKDIQTARESEQKKFGTEREQLQGQITDLTGQITQRDTDLASLNERLTAAQDDAGKLTEVQNSLTALQNQYNADKQAWEARTAAQAYEFAVKTAAGGLKFSSAAARRDFERGAIEKGLKMDGDKILGFDDYVAAYRTADPGAFVKETDPGDGGQPGGGNPPKIVLPGGKTPPSGSPFDFRFTGVRPAPKE